MHIQKNKKIFIYFFLFILLGSLNNKTLKNTNFSKIKNINVLGLSYEENLYIANQIQNLNLQNIFSLDVNEFKNIFERNSLIESYSVLKKYPSSLDITIMKTQFLANININNQKFLVGSNGKLIKTITLNNQLPYIFGKPKVKEILQLKKIIDNSKFSYANIKKMYFFPSHRWDLETKNNILIKLPKDNIKYTLDLIYEFLKNSNNKDINILDARIQNQIILND